MTAVWVIIGAMVGAPARYVLDRAVQARHDTGFPWGTFCVNLVGCAVLGGLVGAGTHLPATVFAVLGTGLCGAFTTYSTFSYETVRLMEDRAYGAAIMNVIISVAAGVGVAAAAYSAVVAALGGSR